MILQPESEFFRYFKEKAPDGSDVSPAADAVPASRPQATAPTPESVPATMAPTPTVVTPEVASAVVSE